MLGVAVADVSADDVPDVAAGVCDELVVESVADLVAVSVMCVSLCVLAAGAVVGDVSALAFAGVAVAVASVAGAAEDVALALEELVDALSTGAAFVAVSVALAAVFVTVEAAGSVEAGTCAPTLGGARPEAAMRTRTASARSATTLRARCEAAPL